METTELPAVAFPAGDNASDTLISGVHFNLTTLDFWNYTLYSNGSLSNDTWCVLAFEPYTPSLIRTNGSFANVTYCYQPVYPIGKRGSIAIGFACAFGIALVLAMLALNRHGKMLLPPEKHFRPIGRRWQWYWTAFTCSMAIISLLTSVDVDRYFLPELPIILTSFFWYMMQLSAMAIVWEGVRHWGSWMERQFIDPDPFVFQGDDRRSRVEFWLPIIFYFWLWLNFFIIFPRNWGQIQMQRYPQQAIDVAMPTATDVRFRIAAFVLIMTWIITVISLRHSIKHYCARNRGILNRSIGLIGYTPRHFRLMIPMALVVIAFQVLVTFKFDLSPLKVDGNRISIFVGGYLPTLLITLIQAVSGLMRPNEDAELLRQRRERVDALNRELGVVNRPAWWGLVEHSGQGFTAGLVEEPSPPPFSQVAAGEPQSAGNQAELADEHEQCSVPEMRQSPTMMRDNPMSRDRSSSLPVSSSQGNISYATARSRPRSGTSTSSSNQIPSLTGNPYTGRCDQRRSELTMQLAAQVLFPHGTVDPDQVARAEAEARRAREREIMRDGPPSPLPVPSPSSDSPALGRELRLNRTPTGSTTASERSDDEAAAREGQIENMPPQRARSMLDV